MTKVLHTALLVGCKTLQAVCLNFIEMTRKTVLIQKAKMMAQQKTPQEPKVHEVQSAPSSPKSSEESSDSTKTSHVQVHSVLRIAQPVSSTSSAPALSPNSSPDRTPENVQDLAVFKSHPQPPPPRPAHPYPFVGLNRTAFDMRQMKNKTQDVKKYCAECNRSFATVGSYTRHLRMIHYKLRPLNCEICGHAFYQRSDLKKHVQRQHQRALIEKKELLA